MGVESNANLPVQRSGEVPSQRKDVARVPLGDLFSHMSDPSKELVLPENQSTHIVPFHPIKEEETPQTIKLEEVRAPEPLRNIEKIVRRRVISALDNRGLPMTRPEREKLKEKIQRQQTRLQRHQSSPLNPVYEAISTISFRKSDTPTEKRPSAARGRFRLGATTSLVSGIAAFADSGEPKVAIPAAVVTVAGVLFALKGEGTKIALASNSIKERRDQDKRTTLHKRLVKHQNKIKKLERQAETATKDIIRIKKTRRAADLRARRDTIVAKYLPRDHGQRH